MQEQNFEKQVQQKMEEFSLTPTAPVWQKVEHEIQQKKKRRRVLLFWLIPFMLIGAGLLTWELTPSLQENKEADNTPPAYLPTVPPSIKLVEDPATTIAKDNTPGSATITLNETPSTIKIHPTEKTTTQLAGNRKATANNLKSSRPFAASPTITATGTRTSKENSTQNITKQITPVSDSLIATNTLQNIQKNSAPSTAVPSIQEPQTPDTTKNTIVSTTLENKQQTEEQKPELPALLTNETPIDSTTKQKSNKKDSKLNFAIQAIYGISSSQTELLSKRVYAADFASSPLTTGGMSGTIPRPSEIEKGRAMGLGILIKRELNQRFNLVTGLNYHRFGVKSYVGQQIRQDTTLQFSTNRATINDFFRNDRTTSLKEYKNNYHFIEIPAAIEWQPFRKLPLHWQSGVSLSYLASTNALIYDPAANIYYENDKLFSKTQIHLQTALAYKIWQYRKVGMHVGPYLQYGLTGTLKNKVNNNYHLLSTGLKAQFSFK